MSSKQTSSKMVNFNDFTDSELSILREAFSLIDSNHDGVLNTKELTSMLRSLARNPTEAEMHGMMKKIDKDGNGDIDFKEFLQAMVVNKSDESAEKDNMETFKVFDRNNDGKIGAEDIRQIMELMGVDFTDIEIMQILHQADVDEDGKIGYEDFIKLLDH